MRLLLDTHALLWSFGAPTRLQDATRRALEQPGNDVYVSAATVWEIAIKRALGKLRAPGDLVAQMLAARFGALPVGFDHAEAAAALPPHHHDPFDRMLVAQARLEGLTLVTRDSAIARYDVPILAA